MPNLDNVVETGSKSGLVRDIVSFVAVGLNGLGVFGCSATAVPEGANVAVALAVLIVMIIAENRRDRTT